MKFGIAEFDCNRTRSTLKSATQRWTVVIRAALAAAWVLVAPWLAALVART